MTDDTSDTVFCTDCGAEINSSITYCSECGAEQNVGAVDSEQDSVESAEAEESGLRHRLPGISTTNSTRRNVLVGGGYTILGLGVLGAAADPEEGSSTNGGGGSTGDGSSNGGDGSGSEYPDADAYHEGTEMVLYDVSASVSQYSTTVSGEAVNESGRDYEYVQLTFALYDDSGAKVGDALANTNGLSAGQRWQFEAFASDSNASTYELNDVTAY